jgi:hypothetical protein
MRLRGARTMDDYERKIRGFEAQTELMIRKAERQPAPERNYIIVLVACGKSKNTDAGKAADLYTSTWFKLARAYAESHGNEWFIMSAKHGLIRPRHYVRPYDQTLPSSAKAREDWAIDVSDLVEQWSGARPAETTVVLLGGKRYRHPLTGWLRFKGYEVEQPLMGLGIGQQQAWLKREVER